MGADSALSDAYLSLSASMNGLAGPLHGNTFLHPPAPNRCVALRSVSPFPPGFSREHRSPHVHASALVVPSSFLSSVDLSSAGMRRMISQFSVSSFASVSTCQNRDPDFQNCLNRTGEPGGAALHQGFHGNIPCYSVWKYSLMSLGCIPCCWLACPLNTGVAYK